jgi:hypothetical protein
MDQEVIGTIKIEEQKSEEIQKKHPVKDFLIETLALTFWVYLISKVFIFDIDLFIINKINPNLSWIITYKLFILLGVIALVWIFNKSKDVFFWFFYIACYPLVIILWKIPVFIVKQKSWTLAFALVNSAINFFKSLKYKFIFGVLFSISILSIFIFYNEIFLVCSVIGFFAVLLFVYIRTLFFVFQPSSIFQIYSALSKGSVDYIFKNFTDKEIRLLPANELNETQLQVRTQNIQILVIWNRFLLFFSKKLKDYQDSNFNAFSYIFNLFFLLLLTIISFASINFAIYKINPVNFNLLSTPNYFIFIYYSFRTFLFGGIGEIIPITIYSQGINMVEQLFAIFLGSILIVLLFSIKNEKYKEELSKTIDEVEKTGQTLGSIIETEYKLTFEQAIEEIKKMKGNLMKIIVWLSNGL